MSAFSIVIPILRWMDFREAGSFDRQLWVIADGQEKLARTRWH